MSQPDLPDSPALPASPATRPEKTANMARKDEIFALVETLVQLADIYPIDVGFSLSDKHQTRLRKEAEKKKLRYVEHIAYFKTVLENCFKPDVTSKDRSRFIRFYNVNVNWINTLSAEFHKCAQSDPSSVEKLKELEKFIMTHPFPRFDLTNGFETTEFVARRMHALIHPEPAKIVSRTDGAEFEASEVLPFRLKVSKRSHILATDDRNLFMGCIQVGVENAILVDDSDVPTFILGKFKQCTGPKTIGRFFNYSLLLKFQDITVIPTKEIELYSSSKEIARRFTSQADVDTFNVWCRERIIVLLQQRPPKHTDFVVFCRSPGCKYVDGFLHDTKDSHQVSPSCPDNHKFCIRCRNLDHTGVCVDVSDADKQHRDIFLSEPGNTECPSCRALITKFEGCNHMTCTHCGQNFCFNCGRTFNSSERYFTHGDCQQFGPAVRIANFLVSPSASTARAHSVEEMPLPRAAVDDDDGDDDDGDDDDGDDDDGDDGDGDYDDDLDYGHDD
jgi:hypothetical protein